ncbi:MAG: TIGR02996 domain-containing protein [Kofleriaceae bacterium]
MGDEHQLLDAIYATPDDDAPRMVYADWLQAQGDPRGELIQLQCQLAAVPDDERRRKIRIAENKLLAAHEQLWKQPLIDVLPAGFEYKIGFARGFIDSITLPLVTPAQLTRVFEVSPLLRYLRFTPIYEGGLKLTQPRLAGLLEVPGLARLQTLALVLPAGGNELAHEVAAASTLRGLRALTIRASVWGDQRFAYDAVGEHLVIDDDGAAVLASSPNLRAVEQLQLDSNRISNAGVAQLAHGRWRLRELDLGHNRLVAGLARALAGPATEQLRVLRLAGTPLGPDEVAALVGGEACPQLADLDLEKCRLGAPGATAMTGGIRIPLRRLRLERNSLGDAGAIAIAGNDQLAGLTELEMGHNRIGQKGGIALAESTHLRSLERLTLNEPRWKPETIQRFATSPTLAGARIYIGGKLLVRPKSGKG